MRDAAFGIFEQPPTVKKAKRHRGEGIKGGCFAEQQQAVGSEQLRKICKRSIDAPGGVHYVGGKNYVKAGGRKALLAGVAFNVEDAELHAGNASGKPGLTVSQKLRRDVRVVVFDCYTSGRKRIKHHGCRGP